MDLLQFLQEDMNRLHRLLLEHAAERNFDPATARQCCQMMFNHIRMMDQYIFPALRDAAIAEGTLRNLEGDHRLILELMNALLQQQTEDPRSTLVRLHLVFSRHVDDLNRFLFPVIRQELSAQQQAELVDKLKRLQQAEQPLP